jgi:predicted nucleic acid-binding Zn ribbon protein
MTTYLYETLPASPDEEPRHYEIKQSMKDDALTHHPETGEPIRRVILGGFGLAKKAGESGPSSSGSCGCGQSGCC